MSGIKGIFFDAPGVFYDRAETTSAYAKPRLAELGYPPRLSNEGDTRRHELHVLANEGRISHEAYWDEILQMYGVHEWGHPRVSRTQIPKGVNVDECHFRYDRHLSA